MIGPHLAWNQDGDPLVGWFGNLCPRLKNALKRMPGLNASRQSREMGNGPAGPVSRKHHSTTLWTGKLLKSRAFLWIQRLRGHGTQ